MQGQPPSVLSVFGRCTSLGCTIIHCALVLPSACVSSSNNAAEKPGDAPRVADENASPEPANKDVEDPSPTKLDELLHCLPEHIGQPTARSEPARQCVSQTPMGLGRLMAYGVSDYAEDLHGKVLPLGQDRLLFRDRSSHERQWLSLVRMHREEGRLEVLDQAATKLMLMPEPVNAWNWSYVPSILEAVLDAHTFALASDELVDPWPNQSFKLELWSTAGDRLTRLQRLDIDRRSIRGMAAHTEGVWLCGHGMGGRLQVRHFDRVRQPDGQQVLVQGTEFTVDREAQCTRMLYDNASETLLIAAFRGLYRYDVREPDAPRALPRLLDAMPLRDIDMEGPWLTVMEDGHIGNPESAILYRANTAWNDPKLALVEQGRQSTRGEGRKDVFVAGLSQDTWMFEHRTPAGDIVIESRPLHAPERLRWSHTLMPARVATGRSWGDSFFLGDYSKVDRSVLALTPVRLVLDMREPTQPRPLTGPGHGGMHRVRVSPDGRVLALSRMARHELHLERTGRPAALHSQQGLRVPRMPGVAPQKDAPWPTPRHRLRLWRRFAATTTDNAPAPPQGQDSCASPADYQLISDYMEALQLLNNDKPSFDCFSPEGWFEGEVRLPSHEGFSVIAVRGAFLWRLREIYGPEGGGYPRLRIDRYRLRGMRCAGQRLQPERSWTWERPSIDGKAWGGVSALTADPAGQVALTERYGRRDFNVLKATWRVSLVNSAGKIVGSMTTRDTITQIADGLVVPHFIGERNRILLVDDVFEDDTRSMRLRIAEPDEQGGFRIVKSREYPWSHSGLRWLGGPMIAHEGVMYGEGGVWFEDQDLSKDGLVAIRLDDLELLATYSIDSPSITSFDVGHGVVAIGSKNSLTIAQAPCTAAPPLRQAPTLSWAPRVAYGSLALAVPPTVDFPLNDATSSSALSIKE